MALPHHKEHQYTIASALPKPCFFEDFCGPYTKASAKGPYFLTEYSTHQLFSQLTLLQQVRACQAGGKGGAGPGDVCWTRGRGQLPDAWAGGAATSGRAQEGGALALGPQRAHRAHRPPTPASPTLPPQEHWRAPCGLLWNPGLLYPVAGPPGCGPLGPCTAGLRRP